MRDTMRDMDDEMWLVMMQDMNDDKLAEMVKLITDSQDDHNLPGWSPIARRTWGGCTLGSTDDEGYVVACNHSDRCTPKYVRRSTPTYSEI